MCEYIHPYPYPHYSRIRIRMCIHIGQRREEGRREVDKKKEIGVRTVTPIVQRDEALELPSSHRTLRYSSVYYAVLVWRQECKEDDRYRYN